MTHHDVLTLAEVASAMRAPLSTVRLWCSSGRLRSFRPGKRRLVRREDLAAFIEYTSSPAVRP